MDLSRLCIHTITTKPWPIETAIERFSDRGVAAMTVWRDALEGRDIAATGKRIRDAGMDVVSLCRGGFFPAETAAAREEALDDNRRAIDEAAALGAPLVVLVCGAVPASRWMSAAARSGRGSRRCCPMPRPRGSSWAWNRCIRSTRTAAPP